MRYLSLIKTFLVMKYKVLLEYKAAFWVASFSQILHYSTELLLLWVLVMRFQNLGGWTADEIVLLYSFQLLTYALAGTFFFGCCNSLSDRIQSGQFDEALTLPMPPLLYEVLNHFTTDYIRHFVLALGCFLFAVVRLNLSFNFWKVVLLIADILGGTLICAAAQLIFSTPNLWMVRGTGIVDFFYYESIPFIRYPITIYPLFLQVLLTCVLPYAFINFFPAQLFLGKTDFSIFSPFFQYLTPLVGAAAFGFSLWFWNWGLKKYQSTGS